ncbi:MAG: TIGR03842 family LLM class F420-dependent oxidoreductase [Solirubrobacterales bacterium]|nr:TIGR03842 family LLM class F420-dependent oxidoreductase [Solirubrobacterales bacterium]MBV9917843.1 TIGR03842 family LLM class F420-dependent oxidoreductase [Solirubrobacterales bacterium]
MLDFGVTFLPDPPAHTFVDRVVRAEELGFRYAWTYDSHILWQEGYVFLSLAAAATSKIKLGHCVTNPGIREPTVTASAYATLQDVSGGRMVMGIGRGDSSRRVVGLQPVPVKQFETALEMIKDLMNGREVQWNGRSLQLQWAQGQPEIPMYVAGYGPRALGVAGRVGDGVIIQLADPEITRWIIERARDAAVQAGREPDALAPIVCAPAVVDADLPRWREETRWFPAMVSNHVKDLIARYGTDGEIPKALTDFAQAVKEYDYAEHSQVGAAHGKYISDEITERFCILGDVDDHVAKLRELEELGVRQVDLYLMTSALDETLERYGKEVIPQFQPTAVT